MITSFAKFLFGSVRNTLIVFGFVALALAFVIVRMKVVNQDYELHRLEQHYRDVSLLNKELKAKKAEKLSSVGLKQMAAKLGLVAPEPGQILVVPASAPALQAVKPASHAH